MAGVFKKYRDFGGMLLLTVRVDPKDLDAITDIAHFYHLSRSDYLRLQIKRVIAREQTEMENWVRE